MSEEEWGIMLPPTVDECAEEITDMMSEDEWITEYGENQCGNCHAEMEIGDMYCRRCGTKRGEGEFKPYRNVMECIYGPMPERRTHVCTRCHYTWTTEVMLDREQYCPECGGDAPYEER